MQVTVCVAMRVADVLPQQMSCDKQCAVAGDGQVGFPTQEKWMQLWPGPRQSLVLGTVRPGDFADLSPADLFAGKDNQQQVTGGQLDNRGLVVLGFAQGNTATRDGVDCNLLVVSNDNWRTAVLGRLSEDWSRQGGGNQ